MLLVAFLQRAFLQCVCFHVFEGLFSSVCFHVFEGIFSSVFASMYLKGSSSTKNYIDSKELLLLKLDISPYVNISTLLWFDFCKS